MGWFRKKSQRAYRVVVHLNGRHPYLTTNDLDYDTRDIVLCVPATDWNDAERQALAAARSIPDKWSWHVKSIARSPA
jgi:hypothetical protein